MKIIECINKFIEKKIHSSEKHIEKALEYRREYPEVAEIFNAISIDELRHMQMLHNAVVKLIDSYRREKGEPPVPMQAVYDYLHEKMIEEVKEVKILQQMYTEK